MEEGLLPLRESSPFDSMSHFFLLSQFCFHFITHFLTMTIPALFFFCLSSKPHVTTLTCITAHTFVLFFTLFESSYSPFILDLHALALVPYLSVINTHTPSSCRYAPSHCEFMCTILCKVESIASDLPIATEVWPRWLELVVHISQFEFCVESSAPALLSTKVRSMRRFRLSLLIKNMHYIKYIARWS